MLEKMFDRQIRLLGIPVYDGTRPSIQLQDGGLGKVGLIKGELTKKLVERQNDVYRAGRSVGRIEYVGNSPDAPDKQDKAFVGTAFLISDRFALTARHVAQVIASDLVDRESSFLHRRFRLNFGAEWQNEVNGKPITTLGPYAEISRVVKTNTRWIGWPSGDKTFGKLDLAILELGAHFLDRPRLVLSFAGCKNDDEAVAIGFPGNPGASEPHDRVKAVFGDSFGFKRASPGCFVPLTDAARSRDTNQWYTRHDSSVLGGNSGSPIFGLTNNDALAVCAVHVAGSTPNPNIAVSLANLQAWFNGYI